MYPCFLTILDESGADQALEAIKHRFSTEPDGAHQLRYTECVLITDERQNHEVSDLDIVRLDQSSQ